MKLIQLNIWMGYLLHSALDFIADEDPDILCTQELLSSPISNGLFAIYQTHEELAAHFPYTFFAPTFTYQALGETISYGNAIYSKFPINDQRTYFTSGEYKEIQTFQNFEKNIRNLQTCSLTLVDGKTLNLANHHGYHDLDRAGNPKSELSMENTAARLKELKTPLIFCGDLNMNAESATVHKLDSLNLRNLTVESGLKTTLSSATRLKENLACDFIFVSHDLEVKGFSASDSLVSDHKALVLEFEL